MFVPKHKRKDNLTSVGDLVDKSTGQVYSGTYFETSKGKKFSGTSPYSSNVKELENIPQDYETPEGGTLRAGKNTYDVLRNDKAAFDLKYTATVPVYFPANIGETDSFKRYFARDKKTGKIVEINTGTYKSLKIKEAKYYHPGYDIAEIVWTITGSVGDIQNGSYIIPGVESKNRAAVLKAEELLPGLSSYLTNYTQFAR